MDDVAINELAARLRDLRSRQNRTLASVAQAAGLSVPYVGNLERGRGNPTLSALGALASALDTSIGALLSGGAVLSGGATSPPKAEADLPSALRRVADDAEFRRCYQVLAERWAVTPKAARQTVLDALAHTPHRIDRAPTRRDWLRVLDAYLLIAMDT